MKTLAYGTMAAGFGCVLVVACGGGVGGDPVGVGNGYDPPPIMGYQTPSDGDQGVASSSGTTTVTDDGGTQQDAAGSASSTTSSSSSSGGAGCPKCDQTLTCPSGNTTTTIVLVTSNGACISSQNGGDITLDCSGNLVQGGQNVGSWNETGSTWTITGDGTLTCTGTK